MKKLIVLACSMIIAVAGCGGGDSSSGSSSSGGGSIPPSGNLSLVPDCSGANCGSSGDQYTGSGIGIWYAVNKERSDQVIDVVVRNLSGQNVYFAYTNWGTSTQSLSTNTSTARASVNAHTALGNWVGTGEDQSQVGESTSANEAPVVIRGAPGSNVTTYSWLLYNMQTGASSSISTKRMGTGSLSSGGTAYVWVASNLSSVTQTHVDAVLQRFTGTNGRQSIYSLGRKWVGEPWGSNANRWNNVIGTSTKDIHIVIADIQPSGYLGYFYAGNNLVKSSQSDSNEALALFVDGPELVTTSDTSWSPITKNAMNVFSTVAHEFQHMIHYYEKTLSRTSKGSPSEPWLDELCAMLFQFFYLAVDQTDWAQVDGPEYRRVADWVSQPNCQLDAWKDNNTANSGGCDMNAHYGQVGALAAYLLRHYGPSVIKGIVQNDKVDLTALESGLSSHSVSLADVQRRWGASLAISGTALPDKYGFPRKTQEGVTFPALNLATLDKARYIYSYLPTTIRQNSTVVVGQGSKNGRYETKVKLPPSTSLTVIVQ